MMPAFFPEVYPDELVYSLLARFYVKSGYLALTYALEDLYIHRYTTPDTEFLNEFRPDMVETLIRQNSLECLVLEHTMFPSYGRFLPGERKKAAYQALLCMKGNFNNLLAIPKNQRGEGRYLRYCPLCAKEDRERYGETYWYRLHQIQGVDICHRHRCYLKGSQVSMERKASPGLWDAESLIPEQEEGKPCTNEKELALTEYACKVFESRMDFEGQVTAAEYLKLHLGKYYRTDTGASISLEKLYQDYTEFYSGCTVISKEQVQKVLCGARYRFCDICQLAVFAGIPAEKLAEIPDGAKDAFREPVYMKVSEELQMEYSLVRQIGEAVLKHYENRERVQRRKRSTVWEKMDEKMLPEVREVVRRMYDTGEERPKRITVSAVRKEMELPDKRIEKMPKCRAEILKYQETQSEYWAREAVWAYEKLVREGAVVSWKKIRVLTNMKKADFGRCLPYVEKYAGKKTKDILKALFSPSAP